MTWFKVDDGFWSHPKTRRLTADSLALWLLAGSYCSQHLTDGYVSRFDLGMLRSSEEAAGELVAAGLWDAVDGGWVFHDWHAYQPTKASVEDRRRQWRESQNRRRHQSVTVDSGVDSTVESTRSPGRDGTKSLGSRPGHSVDSTGSHRGVNRVSSLTADRPTPTPPPASEVLAALGIRREEAVS